MAWIANQEKAPNLQNQRFSLQGENDNDSHLREKDHKRSFASWDGEDSRRTSPRSKAGRIPTHPHLTSQEQVSTEGSVAAKAGIVSQKFFQTGNWEKAAKVLGVVDILDTDFSKEKQCQKDVKPKDEKEKTRVRGKKDETKGKKREKRDEVKEEETRCSKRRQSKRQRSVSRHWLNMKEAMKN